MKGKSTWGDLGPDKMLQTLWANWTCGSVIRCNFCSVKYKFFLRYISSANGEMIINIKIL